MPPASIVGPARPGADGGPPYDDRVTAERFVSYAQNAEDVVLWRALGDVVPRGRYLEVGANHPTVDSISRPFYDRGWRGVTVEPVAALVDLHREARPEDVQVHAVASVAGADEVVLHEFPGTGLSTTVDELRDAHVRSGFEASETVVRSLTVDQILEDAGHTGELHFVVVDTEGSEGDVLAGFDLRRWRPWILVIEATVPNTGEPAHAGWEPGVLAAGYELCLFDGLSRFYVAEERAGQLRGRLSRPANVLDNFVRAQEVEHEQLRRALTDELVRWRTAALTRWADAVATEPDRSSVDQAELDHLRREITNLYGTLSWRVTAPLRLARRVLPR